MLFHPAQNVARRGAPGVLACLRTRVHRPLPARIARWPLEFPIMCGGAGTLESAKCPQAHGNL